MIIGTKNDMGIPFKGMGLATGIDVDLSEDYHIEMYEQKETSVTTVISSLEYCMKKTWFTYHTKIKVLLSDIFKMRLGSYIHDGLYGDTKKALEYIQQHPDKNGELVFPEVEMMLEFDDLDKNLFGTADLVKKNNAGNLTVYDYKFTTTNPYYLPKLTHMLQVLIYSEMVKQKFAGSEFDIGTPHTVYLFPYKKKGSFTMSHSNNWYGMLKTYYGKMKKQNPEEFQITYGKEHNGLPYRLPDDQVVLLDNIKDYIHTAMLITSRIIEDYDPRNWGRTDREGVFYDKLDVDGDKIRTNSAWRCKYCSYSNICPDSFEGLDEKDVDYISTDSKVLADRTGLKLEKW